MSKPVSQAKKTRSQNRVPWILFVLLVATVYLFWVLPMQRGSQPVEVQFEAASKR